MGRRGLNLVFLTVLAVIFTIALTFATVEIPGIVRRLIPAFFPDFNPAIEFELIEEFMKHVRPIGYVCVLAVIVLVVLGFKTGRARLSSLGSLAMFLPTFGYYAAGMFFLTGIGILRILWIPFWDVSSSFSIFKLGDVVYVPYMIVVYPLAVLGVDIRVLFSHAAIASGLLIFCLGTITWFYGKSEGREIVDFWIYSYSRHPQYLGFLIWSYGVMLLATLSTFPRGGYNPGPSLPWMISALIIVCAALKEEIEMTNRHGERYSEYQSGTPFMFPLPRLVSSAVTAPTVILCKKRLPETGKGVVCVFLVYGAILVLLSLPFLLLNWPPGFGWYGWP
jgi:protein-S-isoprenylcysteine O-methyltransferase Ste14